MANFLFQDRILAAAFLELGAELCMFSWLVVVALVLYKCVVKRFFWVSDRRVFFDWACWHGSRFDVYSMRVDMFGIFDDSSCWLCLMIRLLIIWRPIDSILIILWWWLMFDKFVRHADDVFFCAFLCQPWPWTCLFIQKILVFLVFWYTHFWQSLLLLHSRKNQKMEAQNGDLDHEFPFQRGHL